MTTTAPCRELQRMSRGATWDEASRTAQVILSSDSDVGDGVILPHTREAIDWPTRPLPLVVDHGLGRSGRFEVRGSAHIATDPAVIPTMSEVLILVRIDGKDRVLRVTAADTGAAM